MVYLTYFQAPNRSRLSLLTRPDCMVAQLTYPRSLMNGSSSKSSHRCVNDWGNIPDGTQLVVFFQPHPFLGEPLTPQEKGWMNQYHGQSDVGVHAEPQPDGEHLSAEAGLSSHSIAASWR